MGADVAVDDTVGSEELVGYESGGCETVVGYDVTVRSDVVVV